MRSRNCGPSVSVKARSNEEPTAYERRLTHQCPGSDRTGIECKHSDPLTDAAQHGAKRQDETCREQSPENGMREIPP